MPGLRISMSIGVEVGINSYKREQGGQIRKKSYITPNDYLCVILLFEVKKNDRENNKYS